MLSLPEVQELMSSLYSPSHSGCGVRRMLRLLTVSSNTKISLSCSPDSCTITFQLNSSNVCFPLVSLSILCFFAFLFVALLPWFTLVTCEAVLQVCKTRQWLSHRTIFSAYKHVKIIIWLMTLSKWYIAHAMQWFESEHVTCDLCTYVRKWIKRYFIW